MHTCHIVGLILCLLKIMVRLIIRESFNFVLAALGHLKKWYLSLLVWHNDGHLVVEVNL